MFKEEDSRFFNNGVLYDQGRYYIDWSRIFCRAVMKLLGELFGSRRFNFALKETVFNRDLGRRE